MKQFTNVYVSLLLLVQATVVMAQGDINTATVIGDMIEWVRSKGGSFNRKIEIRRMNQQDDNSPYGIYAKEDIAAKENLFHIPESCYITMTDEFRPMEKDEDETIFYYKNICLLTHKLLTEMNLGEQSTHGPYIRYLKTQKPGQIPAMWSKEGKDVLRKVIYPGSNVVDWIDEHFKQTGCVNNTSEEHIVELVLQRGYDVSLIPIWDMVNHDNGRFNTEYDSMHSEGGTKIRTTKDIRAGEEIYATYDLCPDCREPLQWYLGTPEILRDFGFVERYPRRWVYWENNIWFNITETEDGELEVKFDEPTYPNEDVYGIPAHSFLDNELGRIRNVANTVLEKQRPSEVPEHEWDNILQFYKAKEIAFSEALKAVETRLHDEL